MNNKDKIPVELRERPQWVLWKTEARKDSTKPTKLPFTIGGVMAKSNDPASWSTFEEACAAYDKGGYDGIGFMFSADDPFCGIDLDGCRNPQTGKVANWARQMLLEFNTYSEVSPSATGVKLFCRAKLPFDNGKKKELPDEERISKKTPAIEMYDKLRYFAVTGWRLGGNGLSIDVEDRDAEVKATAERFWPTQDASQPSFHSSSSVIERARKYIATMEVSISGANGHNAAFKVACVLIIGFGLERDTALALMRDWNLGCQPPWSERELQHKINQALKQPGERNYLRNAQPQRWGAIVLPSYEAPQEERPRPRATTLTNAMTEYIDAMLSGAGELIGTGVNELDYAIGGGVAKGELIVVAGRPSHGKSVTAMQCAHHWTREQYPTLIITEEMSKLALGRRAIQYTSDIPEEAWKMDVANVRADIADYGSSRAECYVVESCQTMDVAKEEIERHVAEHGVKFVVVDYAQLLQSKGKQRWEQMANTSETLRKLCSKLGVNILALVQMNQEIEKRTKFTPKMSDLGDCICGDSVVCDADTGERLTIRDIVTRDIRPRLWSMDHDGKIVKSRVSSSWSAGRKVVYDAKMRSGRTLRCSGNQKFFTEDGWRELRNIKLGTLIAIPRVYRSGFANTMTNDQAELLGWIVGDGSCTGTADLCVCNEDENFAMELCSRAWPSLKPYSKPERKSIAACRIRFTTGRLCGAGKNPLTSWLRKIDVWGKTGVRKHAPEIIFKSSDRNIASFLRGLFHADGCVTAGQRIRLTTISERLARDVQHLLSRLGIHSILSSEKHAGMPPYRGTSDLIWSVAIGTKSRMRKFMKTVGFLNCKHIRAANSLAECLSKGHGSRDTDKLPVAACIEAERLGWRPKPNRRKRICRITAANLADEHDDEAMRLHAESEVYWDELANVSRVGRIMTYDLTVERTANYAVNDIITHNSGQWARDADLVMFVVWPHRIDPKLPVNEYQFWIGKNRNRAINAPMVTCRFEPSRQRIVDPPLDDMRDVTDALDEIEENKSLFDKGVA